MSIAPDEIRGKMAEMVKQPCNGLNFFILIFNPSQGC